jgi:hypothetical protein
MAYSNADGTSWTAVSDSTFGTMSNEIRAIAYGSNKFVAGGSDGKMAYSSDGVNWTAIPAGTANNTTSTFGTTWINAIAYNGSNLFVAVGSGPGGDRMATSPDGTNWTAVTDSKFGSSHRIEAIAFGNGKFVAVGDNVEAFTTAYSSDGVTWTAVSGVNKYALYYSAIAFGNGRFVAGGGWEIAYSTGF